MRKLNTFFWVKISIALALLIGIPVAGIVEEAYMRRSFDAADDDCVEIIAAIEDGDCNGALDLAEEMLSEWSRTREMLEFIYPNADVKELLPQMGELVGDLKAELNDDAIARAKMISTLAENSKNLLAFKWKNIL